MKASSLAAVEELQTNETSCTQAFLSLGHIPISERVNNNPRRLQCMILLSSRYHSHPSPTYDHDIMNSKSAPTSKVTPHLHAICIHRKPNSVSRPEHTTQTYAPAQPRQPTIQRTSSVPKSIFSTQENKHGEKKRRREKQGEW